MNIINRPICANHGCTALCCSSGRRYRPVCGRCHRAGYGVGTHKKGVTPIRKQYCDNKDERLGFKCVTGGKKLPYKGMLDLDHIDGDYLNNVEVNIQTLCKCCHAWKSKLEGDHKAQDRYAYARK